jgi:hypothetical protein
MWKKSKLSFYDGDFESKNAIEAMAAPMVVSGEGVFGGSVESGGQFYVATFCRNLDSFAMKVFLQLI